MNILLKKTTSSGGCYPPNPENGTSASDDFAHPIIAFNSIFFIQKPASKHLALWFENTQNSFNVAVIDSETVKS